MPSQPSTIANLFSFSWQECVLVSPKKNSGGILSSLLLKSALLYRSLTSFFSGKKKKVLICHAPKKTYFQIQKHDVMVHSVFPSAKCVQKYVETYPSITFVHSSFFLMEVISWEWVTQSCFYFVSKKYFFLHFWLHFLRGLKKCKYYHEDSVIKTCSKKETYFYLSSWAPHIIIQRIEEKNCEGPEKRRFFYKKNSGHIFNEGFHSSWKVQSEFLFKRLEHSWHQKNTDRSSLFLLHMNFF